MKDRNELYRTAQAAIQDVADAHAQDVAMAAEGIQHLASILGLIHDQGWASSWAKDNQKIEAALEFMARVSASVATKEAEHVTPSS